MNGIRDIVVPTDFSDASRAAIGAAVSMARLEGAAIHLVHALGWPVLNVGYEASVPAAVGQGFRQAAAERIESFRKSLTDKGVATVTAELVEADEPVSAIEQAVQKHGAGLVVMGTHGYSGIQHAFLGSVTERTLRKVDCPVLAVRLAEDDAEPGPFQRILVPVDFSPHSDQAAKVAVDLARRLGASVTLIHVIDLAPSLSTYLPADAIEIEGRIREAASQRLEEVSPGPDGDPHVERFVLRGSPSQLIASEAERIGADLIVMGTHGHTGLRHLFLGSVAEKVLRQASCSVLAVKALLPSGES